MATPTGSGNSYVEKAQLTIDLSTVHHKYGEPNLKDYGIINRDQINLVNGDEAKRDNLKLADGSIKDTALKDNNTKTQDVNEKGYDWTATVDGIDGLSNNYNVIVNKGKSYVDKADLMIELSTVHHKYGEPNLKDYGIINRDQINLVNGDEAKRDNLKLTDGSIKDTALKDNNTKTQDASKQNYGWSATVDGIEGLSKNYNITFNGGESYVDKALLTITADDVHIHRGDKPNYKGHIEGVTNGDSLDSTKYHFGVEDPTIEETGGTYKNAIGLWIGNSFYQAFNDKDEPELGLNPKNYLWNLRPGTLTVAVDVPNPHNDYWLLYDYPWDRVKNFRERRAEVHYEDGGVKL